MPREYVQQLMANKGRALGERRVVTILFFDIKGSTAMAEDLDPEEVMDIMNNAFEVLIEPIVRYGGTLARLMGDATLSFFGAPMAHEDDPARACHAALDIVERARRYAETLEQERGIKGFNVRVGINTGLVAMGEVGSDMRVEYTAMGDAVNLAARMENAAEPGTVLITDNTRKLINPIFETEDLGSIGVKGKARPVHVFRLLRPRTEKPLADADGLRASMIGRSDELRSLNSVLGRLEKGGGGKIAIIGDTGVGKSRLVTEARRALKTNARWIEGRCLSYTEGMTYWLARETLNSLLGIDRSTDPIDVGRALRASIEQLSAEAGIRSGEKNSDCDDLHAEIYQCLARLLDVPLDDATEQHFDRIGAEAYQRRMLSAFTEYLRMWSNHKPLVLLWEDLHWVDRSSLDLLQTLLPLTDEIPLVMLLVFRRREGWIWDHHLRMAEKFGEEYQTIELHALSRDESQELLGTLLKGMKVPKEMQRLILDSSEGNPFFMEELIRSLLDAGLLTISGDRVVASDRLQEGDIPNTLHGVIMSRVDRLSPQEKQTLQSASVVGRIFQHGVLAEVVTDNRTDDHFDRSLGELQNRDFVLSLETNGISTDGSRQIWDSGSARLLPTNPGTAEKQTTRIEDEYAFKHAMTAEVVYNNLLKSQRKQMHKRTAEVIESLFPQRCNDLAPTLAHHLELAGAHEQAFGYLLKAAKRATRFYANQEAIAFYRRALALAVADDLPAGSPLRSRPNLAPVHEGLGDVYYVVSEYQLAIESFDRALECVDNPLRQATLWRKEGLVYEKWGRYENAKECFEKGLDALQGTMDLNEAAHLYTGLGLAFYHLGQMQEAIDLGVTALEMVKTLGDDWGIAQASNNLGLVYCKKGSWDKARKFLRQCLSIWENIGDAYGMATCNNNLGLVCFHRGDLDQAMDHYQRSIELFQKLGNQHGLARAYDNLSQVYLERGQEDIATEYVTRAVTTLAEITVDRSEMRPEMWQSGAW